MADQRQREDDLDRIWDDIAGGHAGHEVDRDAEGAETIRVFQSFASAPVPDAARERVWRGLARHQGHRVNGKEATPFAHAAGTQSGPEFGPNGRVRSTTARQPRPVTLPSALRRRFGSAVLLVAAALPAPASPRRWALAQASLALLLVVLAGGLWLTVRRDPGDTGEQAAGDPATVTVSAPVTGISALYSSFVVRRLALEPGSTFQELANGTTLFVIEHGRLTAVSSSGGEQRLGPNGLGSVENGTTLTLRNDADETGGVIVASADPDAAPTLRTSYGPGVTPVTLATGVIKGPLPTDATMTLQRLTVPVGEQAASWQTDGPTWLRVEQGEAGLTLTGHGVPYQFASGVEYFQSSGPPVQLARGIAVDVRNSGTTPLVLTIVGISPGSEPDSAPAT